jgi:hypothetical protein
MGSAFLCPPARLPALVRCSCLGAGASFWPTRRAGALEHRAFLSAQLLQSLLAISFVLWIDIFHTFDLLSNEVDFNDGID